MKPLAVILFEHTPSSADELAHVLSASSCVEKIIVAGRSCTEETSHQRVSGLPPDGGTTLGRAIEHARPCSYVLVVPWPERTAIAAEDLDTVLAYAQNRRGGMFYGDYFRRCRGPGCRVSVIDYQEGSIRDDFDFGPVQLFSLDYVMKAFERHGLPEPTRWSGLYETRLKVSLCAPLIRVPLPLSVMTHDDDERSLFTYLLPEHEERQKEMEHVVSEHLQRLNAFCSHELRPPPADTARYPVEASVVIPVKDREATIAEAVSSALDQETPFPFNVIVVDNHSSDATGTILMKLAESDPRVIRIVPERTDLGIGGCWNAAVQSSCCGRYVCQLDSDDAYAHAHALETMTALLQKESCGMAVGSYRTVDRGFREIPPGVVEHREWSPENGRNNLLRVHGIGAPRAFPTALLRRFPLLNVSYGEDYALALRISRDYPVERTFDPLYLCRRWEDNTEANLTQAEKNRLDYFKDGLRTTEITERRRMQKNGSACRIPGE